jgi:fructose-1,6-bisphosphatase/inositol monophosphatase family enzyme
MTFLLSNEPTTTTLRHSIIDLEFGYGLSNEAILKMVGVVERLLQHGCRATRSLGSGVLDICYIATGQLDVVYAGVANEGWNPWGYCATSVIAVEAGASIEALIENEGEQLGLYAKSGICVGNAELLNECRRVILEGL